MYGQVQEVPCDVEDGEGDAEDDDECHADVGEEEEGDDRDDREGQRHVPDQLAQDQLQMVIMFNSLYVYAYWFQGIPRKLMWSLNDI